MALSPVERPKVLEKGSIGQMGREKKRKEVKASENKTRDVIF